VHERCDRNAGIRRTRGTRAQRIEREADVAAVLRIAAAIDADDQLRRRRRVRFRDRLAGKLLLDAPRQLPQPHRLAEHFQHGAEVRDELLTREVGRAPAIARFQQPHRIGEHLAERVPVEFRAQVIGLEDR
jgi:hypothetical protein